MRLKQFATFLTVILSFSSCVKDEISDPTLEPTEQLVTFSPKNYFSGTIIDQEVNVVEGDFNLLPTNTWFGNPEYDISVVLFGSYFKIENITSDIIKVSFAKSYHDTLLTLNTPALSNYRPYYNDNPFKNSTEFHKIFSVNGSRPFFYSGSHGFRQIPTISYHGLVVELRFNGQWYNSYTNSSTDSLNRFSTNPLNTYEVLKYEILRENAISVIDGINKLPYGKAKIKFDCYLKKKSGGPGVIHIKGAEFQGFFNKN